MKYAIIDIVMSSTGKTQPLAVRIDSAGQYWDIRVSYSDEGASWNQFEESELAYIRGFRVEPCSLEEFIAILDESYKEYAEVRAFIIGDI